MIGYVGVVAGIAVLVYSAFKRVNVIVSTCLCAVIIGLTNQMPFWSIFTDYYLPSAGTWVSQYFLLFVCSGIYARVLSETGSAAAIAYKIIDAFGKERVILATALLVMALTYGGLSGFVSIFLVWPICVGLARETQKPKVLFLAVFYFGFLTLAYAALPGSPQLSNVLAAQMLGTTPTAAPILSLVASIIIFVLGYAYLIRLDRSYTRQGKVFEENGKGIDIPLIARAACPPFAAAVAPMVILLLLFMGLSNGWFSPFGLPRTETLPAIISALLAASFVCVLLNYKKIKEIPAMLSKGAQDAISPLVSLFTMVAFSEVVSATPAFASFVTWVHNIPGHPYFQVAVAANAIGVVTASASTTVQITLNAFAQHWLASSQVNPEALTRIVALASVGLSCGPHAGGMFANLAVSGENLKDIFVPYFIACGVVSTIALLVTIGLALLGIV